jgi:hypothetical protein
VSRVALQMKLDDNSGALDAYLDGDRTSPRVVLHFHILGLEEFSESLNRPPPNLQPTFVKRPVRSEIGRVLINAQIGGQLSEATRKVFARSEHFRL